MLSRFPGTGEPHVQPSARRLPTLRTTLVCLRPMTLRPHEDAMHRKRDATRCNAGQGLVGGRLVGPTEPAGTRGCPRSPSPSRQADRARASASPRATCKLVPTAKMLSLARDTPARTCICAGRLYPKARLALLLASRSRSLRAARARARAQFAGEFNWTVIRARGFARLTIIADRSTLGPNIYIVDRATAFSRERNGDAQHRSVIDRWPE